MKITCKSCLTKLTAPDRAKGKFLPCPKCKSMIHVGNDLAIAAIEIANATSPNNQSIAKKKKWRIVVAIICFALAGIGISAFLLPLNSSKVSDVNNSQPTTRQSSIQLALNENDKQVKSSPKTDSEKEIDIIYDFILTYLKTPYSLRTAYMLDKEVYEEVKEWYSKNLPLRSDIKLEIKNIKHVKSRDRLCVEITTGPQLDPFKLYLKKNDTLYKVDWVLSLGVNPVLLKKQSEVTGRLKLIQDKMEENNRRSQIALKELEKYRDVKIDDNEKANRVRDLSAELKFASELSKLLSFDAKPLIAELEELNAKISESSRSLMVE